MENIGDYVNLGGTAIITALFVFLITKQLPALNAQLQQTTEKFLEALAKQRAEHLTASQMSQERFSNAEKEMLDQFTKELKLQRTEFFLEVAQVRSDFMVLTTQQRMDAIKALQVQTDAFAKMLEETGKNLLEAIRLNILELFKKQ